MATDRSGAIVTIGLEAQVRYTCSQCGQENDLKDTITVTGTTASILALKDAGKNRDLTQLLPRRLAGAGLSCRCGCGHREPWARMNHALLDKAVNILVLLLAAAAVGLYLLHTGDNAPVMTLLAIMAASALGIGGILVYKALHKRKMEKLLKTLPKASLPQLRLTGKL